MPDFVLIEVATGFAPWVFSWWHIGLLVLGLMGAVALGGWIWRMSGGLDSFIGSSIIFSCLVVALWGTSVIIGSAHISEQEADRVSHEITEVTGEETSSEDVRDMQREKYIPGVNYEVLEDSENNLVFKVEK